MLSELARIDEFLLMGGVKRDFVDRSVKQYIIRRLFIRLGSNCRF